MVREQGLRRRNGRRPWMDRVGQGRAGRRRGGLTLPRWNMPTDVDVRMRPELVACLS